MAIWSPDGPEGLEDNVSVGEDIWLRSLEVDLMKIQDDCKDLESKLGVIRPKIRSKGIADGQQVNILVLPLVGPEERKEARDPSGCIASKVAGRIPPPNGKEINI
ncbi:hypothetical protein L195_g039517 [Trifolium pratense]|uniref:Uncharacterized protein n=1 Tax=Trifolium pratense TaxID=57577 RepID=A0A2K3LY61_TRIPR|nr:hypothetical protein L195_g039517 [Trifolium pratense]